MSGSTFGTRPGSGPGEKLGAAVARLRGRITSSIVEDGPRTTVLFIAFNTILGIVAFAMSVVNVFTSRWLLLSSTLLFSVACVVNILLTRKSRRLALVARYLFLVEGIGLCAFFCISGTPEGFSALWTCFIPSFAATLLGNRRGSLYAAIGFAMVAFLFWTPIGRSLLMYDYTSSFMLRFPMIYLAFFAMAFFLEGVRAETKRRLEESRAKYRHLYRYDALTGLYNRHGFNEVLDETLADLGDRTITFAIVDIDLFKQINDTFGHDQGDIVLREVAQRLERLAGQEATVCRWGGEEFTVSVLDEHDPETYAERLRQGLALNPVKIDAGDVAVTVSIGVCVAKGPDVSIGQVVRRADDRLYYAKTHGRDQVQVDRMQ